MSFKLSAQSSPRFGWTGLSQHRQGLRTRKRPRERYLWLTQMPMWPVFQNSGCMQNRCTWKTEAGTPSIQNASCCCHSAPACLWPKNDGAGRFGLTMWLGGRRKGGVLPPQPDETVASVSAGVLEGHLINPVVVVGRSFETGVAQWPRCLSTDCRRAFHTIAAAAPIRASERCTTSRTSAPPRFSCAIGVSCVSAVSTMSCHRPQKGLVMSRIAA